MLRYTVTALTEEIGATLGAEFGDILVEGEVSGFKPHGSGHWYFSLKDGAATLTCAMFRGDNARVKRPPRDGERVVARGGIDVYPPRGTYSMIVRRIDPVGAGDLARILEERKARLAAEGLFAQERKRALPRFPAALGVATSATGAALADILRVVGQRFPGLVVYLASCRVQGDGAAAEIVAALNLLVEHGRSEVIIVGRGGGAAEDLAAFNEESVVRAVAGSPIPVVSAVGHEVDTTLCDLAADVRAATPSHAAELVTPDGAAIEQWVDEQRMRLDVAMHRRMEDLRVRVVRARLIHPRDRVDRGRLRGDELADRLVAAAGRWRERRQDRVAALAARLDALSPLRVLDRGYALVQREGKAVVDATALAPGDTLRLQFARGEAEASVVRVR